MLSPTDRSVATTFKRRMPGISPAPAARVCGSRARGEAPPDSDLASSVEQENVTPQPRGQISEVAWTVGQGLERVIPTLAARREQLERGPMGVSPIILKIQAKGGAR